MNALFPIIAVAIVIIVIAILAKFSGKPRPCEVCGTPAKDFYQLKSHTQVRLCRAHLVERWKKDVAATARRMVVVEPDFEKYPLAYLYVRPKDLQEWSYTPDAIERVLAIVNTIVGKTCASCGGAANAAFYRKHEFEGPHFERLQAPSSYLCS